MTRYSILALALAACINGSGNGDGNQADATRTFAPASVTLERYPAVCGVPNPPFEDADLYSMTLLGSAGSDAHPTMITTSFHRTLPLDQALPVDLQAFGIISYGIDANGNMIDVVYGQAGSLPLTDNSFEWDQGTNAGEIDAQPLTAASVTFDAMPAADGDDGTATIRMVFADGGIYDARTTAPLTSEASGCPAG